jgi:membrane dipeptidase
MDATIPSQLLIVDGHEDLAMNALPEGRNYLRSAYDIRALEAEAGVESPNGRCMLGLPEWLEGHVAVIIAAVTTIPRAHAHPGEMSYVTPDGAYFQGLAQIDLYRRWAQVCPSIRLVQTRAALEDLLTTWSAGPAGSSDRQVGLVLSMENGDPIRDVGDVQFWADQGIRLIGPAWHSNRFSGDTRKGGPLTQLGRELLREMDRLGIALDVSHMSDEASLEALDIFTGPVVATHANSRRTVSMNRMLPDPVVRGIVERDGVIGVMPQNWAVDPSWRSSHPKDAVTLDAVVHAIETICTVAGDARHVGVGTDFDGGAGAEAAPAELETIADLPRLAEALAAHGFSDEDVVSVMSGNWLRFLRAQLPT